MAKLAIQPGATSVVVYVFIRDSSVTTGAGLVGLAYNTASLVASYVRPLASRTAITLATQTVTGAFSSGGFVEVDATNMPGIYRLDIPDAAIATGVRSSVIMLKGAANMEPCVIEIDLTNDARLANGVTHGGSTAVIQTERIIAASTTTNEPGLKISGNGTAAGTLSTGGATGAGIRGVGGATSGAGIQGVGSAGNSAGVQADGQGSAAGVLATGGATGHGVSAVGGATSGDGLRAAAATSGKGINAIGAGTTQAGILATGGATTSAGISAVGGSTSGDAILTAATSGHGIVAAGSGTTKHGIHATGGSTTSHGINALGGGVGHGILATSGSGSTGDGIRATAASTNGNGINAAGVGTGAGQLNTGGATGHGLSLVGGSTSGNGIRTSITAPSGSAQELGLHLSGTLSGTHSSTTADLGTNAPGAGSIVVGMTLYFPAHGLSVLVTAYDTGTGVATFDTVSVTLANGNVWYLCPTAASSGGSGLDAAGVRSALGMSSANLDTQLSTIDTVVDRIEVDTQDLQTQIGTDGAGLTNMPWNASWDAEVQSEVTDALNAYDPPTNAEMEARTLAAASYATASGVSAVETDTQDIQSRLPAALVGGRIDATVDATGMEAGAVAAIADGVWEEALADHEGTVGSTAEALADAGGAGASAADIADAVLDEALSGHTTAGTLGERIGRIPNADAGGNGGLPTVDANNRVAGIVGTITTLDALDTAQDAEHDATQAAIGALNDLDATEVQTAAAAALTAYDPPTNTEMEARTLAAASYATAASQTPGAQYKKNVAASDIPFVLVDSTDHVTRKTGITVTATRSIDGGAFASATGTVAEVASGVYVLDASQADMNGDNIVFRFAGTGCDPVELHIKTYT